MVKIIMHGCCGHMGQVITQLVKEDSDAEIVAGIDVFDNGKMWEKIEILKYQSHSSMLYDFPGVCCFQSRRTTKKSGFSGTGRTDNT